jgi:hypothetical protein
VTIDERSGALTQSLELLAHMQGDAEKRHDREMEDIRREGRAMRADFRRAFAMDVREARNARRRRQELDEKITQLAAAQLVTEEKLQALHRFDGTLRNGNTREQ